VLNGEVDPGVYQPSALSPAERAQGKVLMCCATPLSDIEIACAVQALVTVCGSGVAAGGNVRRTLLAC
jgi:hypothetical protein